MGPDFKAAVFAWLSPKEREAKKRKVRAAEFKAKVGQEALRGVKTINEIGLEFGVHPVQLGQWKKEMQEQAGTLFEGKGRGRWRITKSRTGSTASSAG